LAQSETYNQITHEIPGKIVFLCGRFDSYTDLTLSGKKHQALLGWEFCYALLKKWSLFCVL